MIRILSIFIMLFSVGMFGQCVINGSPDLKVNETQTYTIENDVAQCRECHQWMISGGNTSLIGDYRLNSIKVVANSAGKSVLTLNILSPKGMVQCTKTIEVINEEVNGKKGISSNCDINFSSYKELKNSEGSVTFVPDQSENKYQLEWTISYLNGEQKESKENRPRFDYTKENPITSVQLKIHSAKCTRTFNKAYDSGFWKIF